MDRCVVALHVIRRSSTPPQRKSWRGGCRPPKSSCPNKKQFILTRVASESHVGGFVLVARQRGNSGDWTSLPLRCRVKGECPPFGCTRDGFLGSKESGGHSTKNRHDSSFRRNTKPLAPPDPRPCLHMLAPRLRIDCCVVDAALNQGGPVFSPKESSVNIAPSGQLFSYTC